MTTTAARPQLAISNIAWDASEDRAVASLLERRGITAIEVAPGRLFSDPSAVTADAVKSVLAFWNDHGIRLAAMQAILFGQSGSALFGDAASRQAMAEQLKRIIMLAEKLGCGPLVFGAPRNRQRGNLCLDDAYARAAAFFRSLAEFACDHHSVLCFEPNAASYGCDFVRKIGEAMTLVGLVDHPGLRVQLDVGSFVLEQDDIGDVRAAAPLIGHFHASAPHLAPLGENKTPLTALITTAREGGYQGLVSIEMAKPTSGSALQRIERALDYVTEALETVDA